MNARDDGQWQPITMRVFPDRPDVSFGMVPVWRFSARYEGPDGTVERPQSYLAPGGSLEHFVEKELARNPGDADAVCARCAREWHYFGPRHLDPRFHIRHRAAERDVPRPVSQTYGDARKDWDFVMSFRDRVLRREGLAPGSPPREIAYAFAHELYRNWRGGGPRNHPADVLTHRAWCLGAANATVAILESLGIPARGAAVCEHATCEAFVDGAWRLIDSSNHYINHPPGSDCMLPTDYVRFTSDPTSPDHGGKVSDYHRGIFYHFGPAHHGIPDGRWVRESLVEFCPATARALYGECPHLRFKTLDPGRMVILERNFRMCHRRELAIDLEPGQCLREGGWLDEIDDVEEFEFEIRFAPQEGAHPDPSTTGELLVHVGEEAFRVSDEGRWPAAPHRDDTVLLAVRLPKALFRPRSVNWLRLQNASRDRRFRIPVTIGVVEPYVTPLLPA